MRTTGTIAVLAAAMVALTACSGGMDAATTSGGGEAAQEAAYDAGAPAPAEEAAVGGGTTGAGGDLERTAASLQDVVPVGRLVIRNADVSIEVPDADVAVAELRALARRVGGFVAGAELHRDGGTLVLRVPADRLDETLELVDDIAREVTGTRIATDDVTGEHADLTARLRNLRAYEDELLALLAEVRRRDNATPEALLSVFERVRQVRGEIEQIEQRLATLEDQVALSTVTVTVSVPAAITAVEERPAWHPGEIVAAAARTTLGALQGIATAGIWLVVFLVPLAVATVVPAILVALAVRRWRRRPAPTS